VTPVKVVHVVLGLDIGGLERVVLGLIARLDRRRFAPLVCALDRAGELSWELDRMGVPLVVMPRRRGLDPALVWQLSRTLTRERAAIVHTHNPTPHLYGALASALARRSRSPWPRVVHTKHGRNHPDDLRKVMVNRLASAFTERIVAVADDAHEVAATVERVSPAKVVTIVNGVDTDAFRPDADVAAARAELGVPASGFHIGVVARLSAEKDHATLLSAFAQVHAQRSDAFLTLVGDGSLRQELEALAQELGIRAAVRFVGAHRDVARTLAAFDVFALSSRTEGLSLTLVEAASMGLPIVATRVGGNSEVVVAGETGWLVPPADSASFARALLACAAAPDRKAMGARGRERAVARFSIERMTHAYEAIYDELIGLDRDSTAALAR
jgi:sugar transferase (PEP-CTERM/EpsH1 system associated)